MPSKFDATVWIDKTGDVRARWVVRCSKHGRVMRSKFWHLAATAKVKHQASHRVD